MICPDDGYVMDEYTDRFECPMCGYTQYKGKKPEEKIYIGE